MLAMLQAFAADVSGTNAPAPAGPPTSWVDPDTGHRVIRLTHEPGSDRFYFNYNGYTPDGKKMAYSTPNGISVLNLETLEAKQLVATFVISDENVPTWTFGLAREVSTNFGVVQIWVMRATCKQ